MSAENIDQRPGMNKSSGVAAGVLATAIAAAAIYVFLSGAPADIATGPISFHEAAPPAPEDINTLPPAAAGVPSSIPLPHAPARAATVPDADAQRDHLGGTTAKGRVRDVYVRVAGGVLQELAHAMPHQREGWHYVDIEFPDPIANGVAGARALVPERETAVGVGDVVEMRFARKGNANFFSARERDLVTEIVARADSALARDYQRRIVARARVVFPPGLSSALIGPGEAPATPEETLTGVPATSQSTQ